MKATAFFLMLMVAFSATNSQAQDRQVLHGHIPPAIKGRNLQPVGRLPASDQLSLAIGLPLRDRDGFSNLLQQMYDPGSPQFRHYLTPQEIAARFGPTEQDYAAVAAFARTNGLEPVDLHADRTLLRVEGTVSNIERAFHVKMQVYPHPTEARTFYAPDTEPSPDLAVPILHISGLNNYILPRPSGHVETTSMNGGSATPGGGSGPNGAYRGNDVRSAYVPGTALNGAGQSVGLLELDGYYAKDIKTYETNSYTSTNQPTAVVTNVLLDGASGTPDSDANSIGEVSLDIEMSISMAPGLSNVIVYEAPNCCYYWVDILKQMQENNLAKQLSSSWLFDDDDPNADTIYLEFEMQGQSFFQCSGDYLAFYNGVDQWTDDPNVTLVGGTTLSTTGPGGSWVSETAWTNGDGINGTGGGVSASYMGDISIPPYQQGMNMNTNGGSQTMRNVPDVALLGYYGWVVWNNGEKDWWWGTSLAAPLWAGYTALTNQEATTYGRPTVGFLNPALYAIGGGTLYSSCFHDITAGNNTNSNSAGLYRAVAGYDLCTGWGSPAGTNLINLLAISPLMYQPVPNSNGSVTLNFASLPNSTNVVLRVTSLSTPLVWRPVYTNTTGGKWQFTDTNAAMNHVGFYRVSAP